MQEGYRLSPSARRLCVVAAILVLAWLFWGAIAGTGAGGWLCATFLGSFGRRGGLGHVVFALGLVGMVVLATVPLGLAWDYLTRQGDFASRRTAVQAERHRLARVWALWERLQALRDFLEMLLGLFAVFFIGFAPALVCLLLGLASLVGTEESRPVPLPVAGLLLLCAALAGVLAFWVARLAARAAGHCYPALARWEQAQQLHWQRPLSTSLALEHSPEPLPYPFAVVMAGLLPRIVWPLKPMLGLWWLAHFAAGAVACWAIQTQAEPLLVDSHLAVQLVVPRLAGLAYSFATNVYLMLAVGVFLRRLSTLHRIWRWRLVIDLLLSLSLAVAPFALWLWERLTR